MRAGDASDASANMDNVIALNARQHRQPRPQRLAAHTTLFAHHRRDEGDVFWLKENAELLNILEATGAAGTFALDAYAEFYDTVEARLGEYPQYYRFLISICLDLEDLGWDGEKGTAICAWARAQNLAGAELSDLQRAEAERLLARRDATRPDPGLLDRLRAFIDRSETFSIPNKKAAYELTHIVFYLSEYGRITPDLGDNALRSLTFAGLLAYLDQNYDMLAEICVALRYAGQTPSPIWEGAVMAALKSTRPSPAPTGGAMDDYHSYFVASWLAGMVAQESFPLSIVPGALRMDMAQPPARPLRHMSQALAETRNADWHAVRPKIVARLDEDGASLLNAAERSTSQFDAFYEGFARAGQPQMAPL